MAKFDKEQDEWGTTVKFRLLPALATLREKQRLEWVVECIVICQYDTDPLVFICSVG